MFYVITMKHRYITYIHMKRIPVLNRNPRLGNWLLSVDPSRFNELQFFKNKKLKNLKFFDDVSCDHNETSLYDIHTCETNSGSKKIDQEIPR